MCSNHALSQPVFETQSSSFACNGTSSVLPFRPPLYALIHLVILSCGCFRLSEQVIVSNFSADTVPCTESGFTSSRTSEPEVVAASLPRNQFLAYEAARNLFCRKLSAWCCFCFKSYSWSCDLIPPPNKAALSIMFEGHQRRLFLGKHVTISNSHLHFVLNTMGSTVIARIFTGSHLLLTSDSGPLENSEKGSDRQRPSSQCLVCIYLQCLVPLASPVLCQEHFLLLGMGFQQIFNPQQHIQDQSQMTCC
jgi:hypothetical protein